MVFFGIALTAISSSMLAMYLLEEEVHKEESIVSGIIVGASELSYLSNDYLIYQESQQLARWQTRFISFSNDISRFQTKDAQQKALIGIIEADAQRLKAVFESSLSVIKSSPQNNEGAINPASFQMTWSRIAVQSQGLVSNASQLAQLLKKQLELFQQINIMIFVIFITFLILFFAVSYLMVQRRILKSIAVLQKGTVIIGSGKLDFKLDDKSNDEIGDLSQAFNRMTLSLKEVTASKADLEKEIVERRQVEEALKESEKKYHSLFSNMIEGFALNEIILDGDKKPFDYRFIELNNSFEKLTGIPCEKATGKTVKQVLPGIDSYWIDAYGKVVMTGEPSHFEKYCTPLNKWYETYAYPTGGNQFAVLFRDVTEQKKEEKNRIEKIRQSILKKEREKIAGELHDTVSQILFSSSLIAEGVLRIWEKDPEKALKNLKTIIDLNSSAFLEMRILLYELMPKKISQESLKDLIKRLVDASKGQSNIKIDITIEGDYDFNFKIKHQVYRIAQEAINNVLKHSKASKAKVDLKLYPGDLELTITDNGIGFDTKSRYNKKRFGLNLMRDRAKVAGAILNITSSLGSGSTVSLFYSKNKRSQLNNLN